jgi:hypothetical protein
MLFIDYFSLLFAADFQANSSGISQSKLMQHLFLSWMPFIAKTLKENIQLLHFLLPSLISLSNQGFWRYLVEFL